MAEYKNAVQQIFPMKQLLPFLLLLILNSCSTNSGNTDLSNPTNTLTGKTETIELYYIAWACACANWATSADLAKYQDNGLEHHSIFIEPAKPELDVPVYFEPGRHFITVTGEFYVKPDYPKGTTSTEGGLEKAKVFRYTKIEVQEIPYEFSPKDDTTLTLQYAAHASPGAQWSETKPDTDGQERELIYLERAANTLVLADTLFRGDNLPLQVQVTGQFVSESGYPTGYTSKGAPEPARVFRYRKIKVLKGYENK